MDIDLAWLNLKTRSLPKERKSFRLFTTKSFYLFLDELVDFWEWSGLDEGCRKISLEIR